VKLEQPNGIQARSGNVNSGGRGLKSCMLSADGGQEFQGTSLCARVGWLKGGEVQGNMGTATAARRRTWRASPTQRRSLPPVYVDEGASTQSIYSSTL